MNSREIKVQKKGWIPKKERIWFIVAILISVLILIIGMMVFQQLSLTAPHSDEFEDTFKSFGSNARILLFLYLLIMCFFE